MKTLRFAGSLILAGFFSIPFLKAQEYETLAARTHLNYKKTKTEYTRKKQPVFDLSLGQQTAYLRNLESFVASHLSYPERAQEYGIEGKVRILIEISPEGRITKSNVIDSLGYGCDEAALQLVHNMPLWSPAKIYGVPVKSKQLFEVVFSLQ